jgi:YihY family inner membrane protein
MNAVVRVQGSADRLQQGRPWLACPLATWKKFGDDQAGNLAALIAYYAFVAIFPLLLVLVTVLGLLFSGNPGLQTRVKNAALHSFPVFGPYLKGSIHHSIEGTGIALAIGLIITLLGARGVANAIQNAMNTVWGVPFVRRPGFPWSLLRSLGLIVVIGLGQILTVFLSSLAGGMGHLLTGTAAYVGTIVVSLLLNIGMFWLAFRLGTAREVRTRHLLLGAVVAGVAWQILQLAGGYLVAHQVARASSTYGTFGIVLGLLAWFYLQAQITLYAVELNVVRVQRLWPRSMFPPPLTDADGRAYSMYAATQQRRRELGVRVVESADGDRAGQPADGDRSQPAGGDRVVESAEGDRVVESAEGDRAVQPADRDQAVQPADGDQAVQPTEGDRADQPADGSAAEQKPVPRPREAKTAPRRFAARHRRTADRQH